MCVRLRALDLMNKLPAPLFLVAHRAFGKVACGPVRRVPRDSATDCNYPAFVVFRGGLLVVASRADFECISVKRSWYQSRYEAEGECKRRTSLALTSS